MVKSVQVGVPQIAFPVSTSHNTCHNANSVESVGGYGGEAALVRG